MPAASKRKPTVVIADDDAMIRFVLRLLLRANNYDVIGEAGNGDKALEACSKLKPDLLLLDIDMPGLNGLQVLEKLQQMQSDVRIIMISGDPTRDRVQQALTKGASGFVVKPFNADKVLHDIDAALKMI